MAYLIPLYCIVTAISAVLALLHMKLLLAFYITCSAILALAVGDDLRSIARRGSPVQKMIHAITSVLMLFAALWLGLHCSINLYVHFVNGTWWVLLGMLIGFAANQGVIERRKRPR